MNLNIYIPFSNKVNQVVNRLPIYGKFGSDVFWNISSFVVLGVSGIFINILIAQNYDAATLGAFNQVYAIYILFSQVAVFGINLSVLKYISQFANDRESCDKIISSALMISSITGGLVCLILLCLHQLIGTIFQSSLVSVGLLYSVIGLWCFVLNKVLLSALNGYRLMKSYAFFQAFRYILMLFLLIACILTNRHGGLLPIIFSGTELILLSVLIIYMLRLFSPVAPQKVAEWFKKHIHFGLKSFSGGALSEVNTRVDIIMLGFFTSDRAVGIYSLAATLADGIIQFISVIRTNINPILTKMYVENKIEELRGVIIRGIKIFYPIIIVLGIVSMLIYPLAINVILPGNEFFNSWPAFCILMIGIMVSAGYFPFNMLLIQIGYPGLHTIMIFIGVLINIVLNVIFIPYLNINGAALATGLSWMIAVIIFKFFVSHKVQLRI